jgi:hypothetical protein
MDISIVFVIPSERYWFMYGYRQGSFRDDGSDLSSGCGEIGQTFSRLKSDCTDTKHPFHLYQPGLGFYWYFTYMYFGKYFLDVIGLSASSYRV